MGKHHPVQKWKVASRTNSEAEKLRQLWIHQLTEADRDYWREKLESETRQCDSRDEIRERYQINLTSDNQLIRFRVWLRRYEDEQDEREQMKADQEEIGRQCPLWTMDEVRDEVLRRAYCRALVSGNWDLGLRTIRVHTSVKKFQLYQEKYFFDAAEMMQKIYPHVRVIQKNDRLTDREKINQIRRKLFGVLPEDVKPK